MTIEAGVAASKISKKYQSKRLKTVGAMAAIGPKEAAALMDGIPQVLPVALAHRTRNLQPRKILTA